MILDPKNKPVVSAEEAFKLLGIDRGTGYKSIKDGTFPLPVIRVGRIIRVPTSALISLLEHEPAQIVSKNTITAEEMDELLEKHRRILADAVIHGLKTLQ